MSRPRRSRRSSEDASLHGGAKSWISGRQCGSEIVLRPMDDAVSGITLSVSPFAWNPSGPRSSCSHPRTDSRDIPVPAMVAASFRSICSVDVPDDGVVFDVAGVETAPIRAEDEYPGVRVRTGATIAGVRLPIQIVVGFGDVITPEPIEIEYPTRPSPSCALIRLKPSSPRRLKRSSRSVSRTAA